MTVGNVITATASVYRMKKERENIETQYARTPTMRIW